MRKFICIIALVALSGCEFLGKPHSLDTTPPNGPIEYRKGWTDGCETGQSAYSGQLYKVFGTHKLQYDAKLRNNKMYYQAWKDAFFYCALYWETINRSAV
jgi:hypothetical protein